VTAQTRSASGEDVTGKETRRGEEEPHHQRNQTHDRRRRFGRKRPSAFGKTKPGPVAPAGEDAQTLAPNQRKGKRKFGRRHAIRGETGPANPSALGENETRAGPQCFVWRAKSQMDSLAENRSEAARSRTKINIENEILRSKTKKLGEEQTQIFQ
jgi:hypothetical protein